MSENKQSPSGQDPGSQPMNPSNKATVGMPVDLNEDKPPEANSQTAADKQFLGLSTDQLAGISVDELTGNKTAVTMMMHYYRVLSGENSSLRNDLNTLRTYVDGYRTKKTNSAFGAVLLLLSNIFTCFGVNLLTSNVIVAGIAVFAPGLCMAIAGLYFSLKEE